MDIKKIRNDFPMLKNKMSGHDIVYFDNGATTFKPFSVISAVTNYYTNLSGNAHRGDYELSLKVDEEYEGARKEIASFINAKDSEIVFTSGDTASLNTVIYGLQSFYLKKGDVVLLTEAEHASNLLPWYKVANETGIVIKYIPLDKDGRLTTSNLKKVMSNEVKVVAFAHVSNVLGYVNDAKELIKIARSYGALSLIDAAQSVPHLETDVKDLDCDFLTFSGHKMCGPTGIGVLYGKYELLDKMHPVMMGGGMNTRFSDCGEYFLKRPPYKFEAGTPMIEAAIGLGAAAKYLKNIGMKNIMEYEHLLKKYLIKKMKAVPNVTIYNETSESGIVTFNLDKVFAQDAASHFNSYGIAVRAGNHCAKILSKFLNTQATLRASVYFYNTVEEIDYFIEVLQKGDEFLDVYFK